MSIKINRDGCYQSTFLTTERADTKKPPKYGGFEQKDVVYLMHTLRTSCMSVIPCKHLRMPSCFRVVIPSVIAW